MQFRYDRQPRRALVTRVIGRTAVQLLRAVQPVAARQRRQRSTARSGQDIDFANARPAHGSTINAQRDAAGDRIIWRSI